MANLSTEKVKGFLLAVCSFIVFFIYMLPKLGQDLAPFPTLWKVASGSSSRSLATSL